MKRKIILFFLTVFCFILQNTLLDYFSLGSVTPNLLLIITASFGFMDGCNEGMYVGFLCGLFVDIFYGNLFGYNILVFSFIGFTNGLFNRIFYDVDIKLPMCLIAVSDLAYGLFQWLIYYVLQGDFEFWFYFSKLIVPEILYTIVVTLIIYKPVLHLSKKLELNQTGSSDKYVE